jgi:MFS family permease
VSERSELRAHWTVVFAAAMGAAAGITGMSVYSLSILIGPLSEAFGWSRAEVSAAKTVLTAGFVLTGPLVGYLADRIGVRQIGIASLALLALGMFSMTLIGPSILGFYVALFLLAVAGCGTTALVWTRAVATWFDRSRGMALALTLTGPGLMGVVTPVLLDTLIQRYGWRAGYITMGVFALITLVPLVLFFRENRDDGRHGGTVASTPRLQTGVTVKEAVRSRHFWQIGFSFLLIGGVVSALMVHLVPLIIDAGLGRGTAVRIAGVLGIAVIVGRMLTGYLVDRFHPPTVAAVFLFMPVFGCLLLIAGPESAGMIVLAVAFIGLAAGSEVDLVPYLTARYFGLKAYGRIYSWMFVAFYVGVGIGPLFLGWRYDLDGHYTRALEIVIPFLIVGVLAIATLGRPPESASRPVTAAP